MATELSFTEGLHYMKGHNVDGITVYGFLVYGQTVGAGTVTSSSTLAGLSEENGTGYTRTALVLGADANGVALLPSWSLNPGAAVNWHSTASGVGIATASSGGVALYFWDLIGGPYDMSKANANLLIPSVNFFYQNPGGI